MGVFLYLNVIPSDANSNAFMSFNRLLPDNLTRAAELMTVVFPPNPKMVVGG